MVGQEGIVHLLLLGRVLEGKGREALLRRSHRVHLEPKRQVGSLKEKRGYGMQMLPRPLSLKFRCPVQILVRWR